MRRRQVLALSSGALFGTAGCLGSGNEPATGQGGTTVGSGTPPTAEPITTTVGSLAISLDSVQPGVVKYTYPDAIGLVGTDHRYVAMSIDVEDATDPPALAAFSIRFDGTEYSPQNLDETDRWRLYRFETGSFYTSDDPGGRLLFELPLTGDASDAALTWNEREWPLPESIRERMTVEPAFSVSLEEVPTDGSLTLSTTNESDRPQRFLLAMNQHGPSVASAPFGVRSGVFDGGTTATFEIATPSEGPTGDTDKATATPSARLTFDWLGGDAERTVELD